MNIYPLTTGVIFSSKPRPRLRKGIAHQQNTRYQQLTKTGQTYDKWSKRITTLKERVQNTPTGILSLSIHCRTFCRFYVLSSRSMPGRISLLVLFVDSVKSLLATVQHGNLLNYPVVPASFQSFYEVAIFPITLFISPTVSVNIYLPA
jgi:hypothetical protein